MRTITRIRKHHTVPQFLLRNFAGSDGLLSEYDIRFLKRYEKHPSQVAHSEDFYTFETVSGPSGAVEIMNSQIESSASTVVRRLERGQSISCARDIDDLVMLAALQAQRTPATRTRMEEFLDNSRIIAESISNTSGADAAEVLEALDAAKTGSSMNYQYVSSLQPIYRLMRRRGWSVVRSGGDSTEFIIADCPVSFIDRRSNTSALCSPLMPYGEDSVLFFPLSPTTALLSFADPIMSTDSELPRDAVGYLNLQQILGSTRRFYARGDDFYWGTFRGRQLGWDEYVADQREARSS